MTWALVLWATAAAQSEPEPADVARGSDVYARSCVACHGAEGQGSDALRAVRVRPRSFADGRAMARVSDAELEAVVRGGGPAVGRSPLMPAWGGVLTDTEVADVIAYIRTLALSTPVVER